MKKVLIPLLLTLSACTKDYNDLEIIPIVKEGPLLSVNYNIPSHDYKQQIQPILDFADIIKNHSYDTRVHTNTSLSVADFNSDGYADLYFHDNYTGNDGTPVTPLFITFNPATNSYTQNVDISFDNNLTVYHSRKTITGDFNLDGRPDVVRVAGAHDFLAYSNITLSTAEGYVLDSLTSIPESQYHTLCSGDIDNDGDLDIFFGGTYEDGFGINNGYGQFDWVRSYEVIKNYKVENSLDGDHGKYGAWTSEMTDINSDGYIDIILAGQYETNSTNVLNGITVIYGSELGYDYNERTVLPTNTSVDVTHDLSIVDVNKDGKKDLIALSGQNGNTLINYIEQTDNGFESKDVIIIGDQVKGITWIVVRDIDNDGYVEITEQESSIFQYTNQTRKAILYQWNGKNFVK